MHRQPGKSLWKIISTDRFIGRSFLTGVIGYDNDLKNNYDLILKVVSNRLEKIEEVFRDFKPDIFIPMVAGGSVGVFMYHYLCKKYDVLYAVHFDLRTNNFFSYTSTLDYTFPIIEKDTINFLKNPNLNNKRREAEILYENILLITSAMPPPSPSFFSKQDIDVSL